MAIYACIVGVFSSSYGNQRFWANPTGMIMNFGYSLLVFLIPKCDKKSLNGNTILHPFSSL